MTETEKKALALVRGLTGKNINSLLDDATFWDVIGALYRAIEQHEAYKQEVSDALEQYFGGSKFVRSELLNRFIIAKPDPLVEALEATGDDEAEERAWRLRTQLAARGLEIREKQP